MKNSLFILGLITLLAPSAFAQVGQAPGMGAAGSSSTAGSSSSTGVTSLANPGSATTPGTQANPGSVNGAQTGVQGGTNNSIGTTTNTSGVAMPNTPDLNGRSGSTGTNPGSQSPGLNAPSYTMPGTTTGTTGGATGAQGTGH